MVGGEGGGPGGSQGWGRAGEGGGPRGSQGWGQAGEGVGAGQVGVGSGEVNPWEEWGGPGGRVGWGWGGWGWVLGKVGWGLGEGGAGCWAGEDTGPQEGGAGPREGQVVLGSSPSLVSSLHLNFPLRRLTTPDWTERHLLWKETIDWSDLYVIHVMSHLDFTKYTPENIRSLNCTFGAAMRYIYYGSATCL